VVVHPKIHPSADRLEVVDVYGYSVCIGKGEFQQGELGVYIPPDSIVPENPVFSFVWEMKGYAPPPTTDKCLGYLDVPAKYRRIKARTLRGVPSEGLLMPLKAFPGLVRVEPGTDYLIAPGFTPVKVGDDVATILGITHYDPPDTLSMGGECERPPDRVSKKRRYPKTLRGWFRFLLSKVSFWRKPVDQQEHTTLTIPDYDIEAWQKYGRHFQEGEEVWITEKIHGANSRYVWVGEVLPSTSSAIGGRMYCGSHHQWKKETSDSPWWKCLHQNPWILDFCQSHPGYVLYGELVPTQKLKYGQAPGEYKLFAFDVLSPEGKWLSYYELEILPWTHTYMTGEDFDHDGILQHWVPTVSIEKYESSNPDKYRAYSNGQSLVDHAGHLREGIVIKPTIERNVPHFGRLILKLRSVEYLGSKQSEE
jgi:RNA ligase (TIGR02306 family)